MSGYLHAFKRDGGEFAWNTNIKEPQYLLLDQFQDLPLVILAARLFEGQNAGGMGGPGMGMAPGVAGRWSHILRVTSIQKNGGKAVFDERMAVAANNNNTNFFGVRMDPRATQSSC